MGGVSYKMPIEARVENNQNVMKNRLQSLNYFQLDIDPDKKKME